MVTLFFFFTFATLSVWLIIASKKYDALLTSIVSVVIKLALCVLGLYVALPFAGKDAVNFEKLAWRWSQGSLVDVFLTFDVSKSYLISSITAVFYNLFGRNLAIPVFINGILGVLIFYFSLVLQRKVWGYAGGGAALLVACHPMLNVNSAVVLRENYIILFSVLASIGMADFLNNGRKSSIFYFLFNVFMASFFHAGMILYGVGLPIYLVVVSKKVGLLGKASIVFLFLAIFISTLNFMDFGKFSDVQEGDLSVEYLAGLEADRQESNTAYLTGMVPSGTADIFWQAPIRSLYFLTKPFPWDVNNFGHLLVFIDSLIWWAIMFLIWKNWASIKRNPAAIAILFSCLVAVVAFAYGTGNFGTAVRHRSKFIIMGLVLVSPFLPRFRLKK